MNQKINVLPLIGAIVVLLFVGAFQGHRLGQMRETEIFYRWVLSASLQSRFGQDLEPNKSPDLPESMDEELFAKVLELAQAELVELPVEEDDLDAEGNPHHVLLRAARQEEDRMIYDLVAGKGGRSLKGEFFDHLQSQLLQSVGTQFQTASLYDEETRVQGVGLTSMFFGFRKVAANFLWLEVDKYWHSGEMHRMVPLMRTSVALDPNFVDAYLLGAWHLAYNLTARIPETPEPNKRFNEKYGKRLGKKEEWYYVAADFLKDGIDKNPRDYRVYFDLGYAIYENKLKDHGLAVLYLDEARRYQHDKWVPRMLYLAQWRNGQYEDAIQGWEEYSEDFPNNLSAIRFTKINRGYLAEARAEQANECKEAAEAAQQRYAALAVEARESGDLQKAELHEAESRIAGDIAVEMAARSEEEWENARKIWTPMIEISADPIAKARMMRQRATRRMNEGRYYEAIAELELARYEFLEAFDEVSDLMIEVKQKFGISLTISERLAVERKAEAALYNQGNEPKKIRYIECKYLQDDMDPPA